LGIERGSKACSVDADCFMETSCLGCGKCFSTPLVREGDIDCKAFCGPQVRTECSCIDNKCEVGNK